MSRPAKESPLSGRVALVTGAASGIGKVIAQRLAAQGAITLFADRNESGLARAAAESPAARTMVFDVSSAETWHGAVAEIEATHGRLDVLVNCAGAYLIAPVAETALGDWNRVIDSNLSAVFYSLKFAAPLLAKSGDASIVNIASTLALKAREGLSAYAASKAGVLSLTRSAAIEFAQAGAAIRVNAVCPGPTDTPILNTVDAARLRALGGADAVRERARQSVPLGRFCLPEEIADAVLFLVSPDAAFVTGACLAVDGGQSA